MTLPVEKQPGFVPCRHCGEYEGKVACRGCHFLVCGSCALDGCPEALGPLEDRRGFYAEGVEVDAPARMLTCDGQLARFEDVLEVIAEAAPGRGELPWRYEVRIVLGDRPRDFVAVRIRSAWPMRDLDALVTARGEALARAIGVPLRVERG